MAFDGIVTKSVISELQSIVNYKIDKVTEPNKNNIILGLYGKCTNYFLNICIDSNNCRIHLTKNLRNKSDFCT